jgi:hypothetical protein
MAIAKMAPAKMAPEGRVKRQRIQGVCAAGTEDHGNSQNGTNTCQKVKR